MKSYIYVEKIGLADKGFNRAIQVYRIKNNVPEFLGANYRLNSAAWRGARTESHVLINELKNHKLKNGGYSGFESNNIQLLEL